MGSFDTMMPTGRVSPRRVWQRVGQTRKGEGMKRVFTMISVTALLVMTLAPAALAAPSDGNGNKGVETLEFLGIPIFCDEDEVPDLTLDVRGWIQDREFKGNSKNIALTVFHINAEFSNSDGDSWTWRDRGPDRLYVDGNGDEIVAVSGRSGLNNIGHVLLNLTQGTVDKQAGRAPFGGELFERGDVDYACDTLTG